MSLLKVEVEVHQSTTGESLPRRFCTSTGWLFVQEILDRWYHGKGDPEWPPANYYKVLADDQRVYLLKHELASNEWYLVRQW